MADPVPPAPPLDRWMLPGVLARAADADRLPSAGPVRRTPRDWAVDIALFLLAGSIFGTQLVDSVLQNPYGLPMWLRIADPVLGVAACGALWWRRRFPVTTAAVAVVSAAMSNTATGAVLVLLFSLALHRGWTWALPATAGVMLLGLPYIVTYFPRVDHDPVMFSLVLVLGLLLVVTAGLGVRARRQLVLVLQARAEEARRDHERRLADGRRDERERIAREMHDTLAHRISLLSVHAGALEYRSAAAERGTAPALSAAEVHEAVTVVRSNAHQALEELGAVLRLLRGPGSAVGDREDGRAAPQPTARRLPALLDEARRGGQQIRTHLDGDLDGNLSDLPAPLQRTVYRLVQEGLTNARKHAPGTVVEVAVRAELGREVVVEISNPTPIGVTTSEIPGAGAGLVGLSERVSLHGGALTWDVSEGNFRLRARIPWPS